VELERQQPKASNGILEMEGQRPQQQEGQNKSMENSWDTEYNQHVVHIVTHVQSDT